MTEQRPFCSKILLFGEYSIIKNSMALSIPYSLFEGFLRFKRENKATGADPELKSLVSYLKKIFDSDDHVLNEYDIPFDFKSFEFDVGQGLIFDSTIPQGYGVGSSGALTAAIFDLYGEKSYNSKRNLNELKGIFSVMESHFHGSSSGMDPLISYLGESILVKCSGDLEIVKIRKDSAGEGAIFLLNTGRSRKTEPLVNLFLEKCKAPEFNYLCEKDLLPITNACISNFLEGDSFGLYSSFKELSSFQFQHFNPMIPHLYRDLWAQGLESDEFYLKLCGAGGGGFLLGITRDFKSMLQKLADQEIRQLCRF